MTSRPKLHLTRISLLASAWGQLRDSCHLDHHKSRKTNKCPLLHYIYTTSWRYAPNCLKLLILITVHAFCVCMHAMIWRHITHWRIYMQKSPVHTPHYGTQFFRFYTHFHRKVPASEVHVPPPPLRKILDPPLLLLLHTAVVLYATI